MRKMGSREGLSKSNPDRLKRVMRRHKLSGLMRRGILNYRELAGQLDCSAATVREDVQAIEASWRKENDRDSGLIKARLLAELGEIKKVAWEEFDRSKSDSVEITETSGPDGDIRTVKTKGQTGDPRYLVVVANVVREELEVHGLKVKKTANTTTDGKELASAGILDEIVRLAELVGVTVGVTSQDAINGVSRSLPDVAESEKPQQSASLPACATEAILPPSDDDDIQAIATRILNQ